MAPSFADPANAVSLDVDQTYFNVGWGGIRASSLPYALEPDRDSGSLGYADVNAVDYIKLCGWGNDGPGAEANEPTWPGERTNLKWLGGYTTFVEGRLLVNQAIAPVKPWCRDNSKSCYSEPGNCMVSTCTEAQIAAGTHTRIQLKIRANSSPNCAYHAMYGSMISLQCNMRDTGFGRTTPHLSGAEPCSPWADVGFFHPNGGVLPVAYIRHWSWSPNNRRVYFAGKHFQFSDVHAHFHP